jgi:flagellar basal-body rod protein FlgF
MEVSTYIALSGQSAREHQMEVLSNNIANISTPGFKGEKMMFQEYLSKPKNGGDASSYVVSQGNARDMSQGPLNHTGNPLDVALNGAGFMPVTTPTGTQYTRNGHMEIDSQGELVTTSGFVVQGDGGSPIVIPSGTASITIAKDGTVSTEKAKIGKLSVVNFDNPQALAESASGLYTTDQAPAPATGTSVEQGTIEESNIKPVVEMTKLMDAAHQIGMSKTFADGEHTRLKNAIDRLGKTV